MDEMGMAAHSIISIAQALEVLDVQEVLLKVSEFVKTLRAEKEKNKTVPIE